MRSEAGEIGGVTRPLQDDGQLLDAFGKRLRGLQLVQGHRAEDDKRHKTGQGVGLNNMDTLT